MHMHCIHFLHTTFCWVDACCLFHLLTSYQCPCLVVHPAPQNKLNCYARDKMYFEVCTCPVCKVSGHRLRTVLTSVHPPALLTIFAMHKQGAHDVFLGNYVSQYRIYACMSLNACMHLARDERVCFLGIRTGRTKYCSEK